jgi:signal transduction histidine kinase
MNLYGISCILTGITGLSMAVFVYIKGHNHKLARIWSVFALATAFYGFGAYMVTHARNAPEAFFWWQFAYIGVILLPFLFVCLAYELLSVRHPGFLKTIGALTIVMLIANLFFKRLFLNNCTLYFTGMKWVTPVYFIYPPGPLLKFFIIFMFFGLVLYTHVELIKNYGRTSGLKRDQVKYFFSAAALGFIGGGASFLPCFGISFYPIFNFTVPLYFLILSFAILRYRLMDLKIAVTRSGIFLVVYTLVLGVPFAVAIQFKSWLIALWAQNWWLLPAALMTATATAGPSLYIYLQRKAEDRLLKEQRRYHEVLRQTGLGMTRIRNLQKLLDLIVDVVTKNVRISHSAVYLYDEDSGMFYLKAGCNLKNGQHDSIDKESAMINWFQNQKEPLVYEEVKQGSEEDPNSIFKELKNEMQLLNAAVVIPSFLETRLSNLLILGDKISPGSYSLEDLSIFSILANQLAVGIENAQLYGNIEEQVRQRTKELMEVQKQLVQAEKLATVGTLAGGVAHEINNPLTAILTNVQMLLAQDSLDGRLDRESLELIEEATKRCKTIVQKLMAYAKKPLESREISEVDLLNVVENVVTFLDYQLQQENIKIIVTAKGEEYLTRGNFNELEQVVTNIVLNARDAIKQIKKSGEIHISLLKSGDWIKLQFQDEGAGIPKEIMSKIFDPFFTTKEVGRGLGLGLSICQAIVEKHKGLISVQSEVNKGSTITVQLPKARLRKQAESKVM